MISKIIASSKISEVEELLDKYEKIVIVTHVSPDGDAIGSSLGLYHYLNDLGNNVNIIVPNSFPDFLKWIPGAKDIIDYEKYTEFAQKLIAEAELIFCLDFNVPKRSHHLAPFIEAANAKKVLIDHHPEPTNFCDVMISHPEISSTSELIFRLICRMGDFEAMSNESATAIYTGMMTDTGAFTYNSNNAEIYYIIGELLKKGINKDQIYSNVYHNYSEDRYRMLGYTLCEKMKIYPEYNAALIWLTNEEQNKYNVKKGDTEGFANLPLNIKGIIFSVFIREDNDFIKISFRSQGTFPSNKFAAECYNGGGHLNAAGGEFKGTMKEAIAIFENALPEYGNLLKKK
ncbi:bifunctional oligoribonuclease/PAP phosphatase NrnA [Dysgonomonas sp. BGC7]|uniref:DHH family phosphoesterase n=1 Tax=Dysgonomonas sp. BGC7 TaxID=1658008 RepID=UPI000682040D|nr:bifunctional oligoribonuclease/PAP phosphatase NrnA [Dysgonomonas sp. BGC7]MBD8388737.1 bifunctional oligoribonuclease/PAP phosphatase NrnA [Dysgonomonas sp. BGC7]